MPAERANGRASVIVDMRRLFGERKRERGSDQVVEHRPGRRGCPLGRGNTGGVFDIDWARHDLALSIGRQTSRSKHTNSPSGAEQALHLGCRPFRVAVGVRMRRAVNSRAARSRPRRSRPSFLRNGAGPSGEGRNSKVAILSSLTCSSSFLLVVAVPVCIDFSRQIFDHYRQLLFN
jgi:hypothetical protein